jgi:hypothetical protein
VRVLCLGLVAGLCLIRLNTVVVTSLQSYGKICYLSNESIISNKILVVNNSRE